MEGTDPRGIVPDNVKLPEPRSTDEATDFQENVKAIGMKMVKGTLSYYLQYPDSGTVSTLLVPQDKIILPHMRIRFDEELRQLLENVPQPESQPQRSAGPHQVLVSHNNAEGDGDLNSGLGHDVNVGSSTNVYSNLEDGVTEDLDGVGEQCDTGIDSGAAIGRGGGQEGNDFEIGEDTYPLTSTSISISVETPYDVHGEGATEDFTSPHCHGGDEIGTGTRHTARASEDSARSGENKTLDDCMDDDDDDIIFKGYSTPMESGTDDNMPDSSDDCQDDNASGNDGGEMADGSVDPPTYGLRKRNIPYNRFDRGALVATPPQKLKDSVVGSSSMFQCGKCDRRYGKACHLERHIANTHHRQAPEENPKYECSVCPKVYYIKENYDGHVRRHAGAVKCPVCSKDIRPKWYFKHHMLTHDSNRERRFRCDLCPKMFFSAKNLQSHQSVHSNTRKFKCKDCTRLFKRPYDLTAHMVVHSNIGRFCCTLCEKSFMHRRTLKGHLRCHEEEKTFPAQSVERHSKQLKISATTSACTLEQNPRNANPNAS